MGFSRQEYWSGLPFLSPGDLPDPGMQTGSLMSPELASGFFTSSAIWEALKVDAKLFIFHSCENMHIKVIA